jgi:glycosyltransferase involved in cell wall biosynthesis
VSKILITTGIYAPEIGGPASYCDTLASRLSKDHTVTVLTYSKTKSYKEDAQKPYKIVRVWKKYPRFLRHALYFLKAYGLAGKHDIVFALNAVSAGFPAMKAARWRGKKFFVKIVGDYAWEIAAQVGKTPFLINDFQHQAHQGWIKRLHTTQVTVAKEADGVIVPSHYLAGLVAGWGVDASRIKVIYNGVEFECSDLSKEEARKKIAIPGTIITTAGRLVSWKGFKMLIKIMPQLLEIHPFFRLIIIGEGPDKLSLQSMIKNMGLTNKVFLVGKKSPSEMAVYFAASDMFVLNSGYEGFSHQLLEVMQCKVPIIASAVGGNKEVIKQGHNGFLIKYNDEFNIIEAIKGLWKLPELRDQFTQEASETVSKYTAQKMYDETIDVILGHAETGVEKIEDDADQDIPDITEIINKDNE